MRNFLKKTGLIGLGVALGVLLSVHFSAIANQESKPAIPYEDLQLLAAVFGKIKSSYVEPVPDDKLIREAINGMVRGLDPHSDFLDGRDLEDLKVSTQGKFGGLGIEVNSENEIIKVVSPIEDTPAFRAGIKAGDLIIKIDDTVTRGLPLSKAVEMMRGKPGTRVTLTITRKDEPMPLVFKLQREEISIKSVRHKIVEPGYGFVRISNFQERTGEDLVRALKTLYKEEPLKGLVLDLRTDPGGLLNQAVSVSAAFLPRDSLIVYTEGRTTEARMELKARRRDYLGTSKELFPRDYLADLPPEIKAVPMVVLIDGGSASASEIVAGALQDHKRATVMGTPSFGKGSVQTIMQIDASHALKLTTARYYTPSGRSIQAKGIEPDVVIDDGRDVMRTREANLDHHMATSKNGDDTTETPATSPPTPDDEQEDSTPSLPPTRLEFGSPEDFQLQQALNQLKGLPVIAALKKEDKKNDVETAEKKPQETPRPSGTLIVEPQDLLP